SCFECRSASFFFKYSSGTLGMLRAPGVGSFQARKFFDPSGLAPHDSPVLIPRNARLSIGRLPSSIRPKSPRNSPEFESLNPVWFATSFLSAKKTRKPLGFKTFPAGMRHLVGLRLESVRK